MVQPIPGNVKKRLLSLYEMSKRGAKGSSESESELALRFLNNLLKRYGLSVDDLTDDFQPTVAREYKFTGKYQLKLLLQLVFHITQKDELLYTKRRGVIGLKLTKLQHAQLESLWPLYRRDFKKYLTEQIEVSLKAFIHANKLYGAPEEGEAEDIKPLTKEKRRFLRRVCSMINDIEPTVVHKQINGGSM